MELEKALQGLIISRSADGVSPHTLTVYRYGVNKLISYLDNPDISEITKQDLQNFFIFLRQEENLAESSIRNVWRAIRVLFNWVEDELDIKIPYYMLACFFISKNRNSFLSSFVKALIPDIK